MGILAPIGRLLFSAIFIFSGLNHFMQYSSMVEYARSVHLPVSPELAIIGSGVVLVLGGLSVLLGFYARAGAALLFLFLLSAAFFFHHFWDLTDPAQAQQQMVHFMKNLSMAGGALLIMYFGPGPFSLSRRKEGARRSLGMPLR
ncbi:DoxX family protein [Myxococcaceae bacterium GXIMD 01537]